MNSLFIGIACIVLLSIMIYEMVKTQKQEQIEGFATTNQEYFAKYYPKRSDVVPGQTTEREPPWIRDLRYKEQYVDIQKLGTKSDLCRVVVKRDDPGSMIMACALAGTDGTTSVGYRTRSKKEGFKFSRDDYFKDVKKDLRDDYCRIIKVKNAPEDTWEVWCAIAGLESFEKKEMKDTEPPDHIVELNWFYEGIMMWYRFKDDMIDYAENTKLGIAGNIQINQNPTANTTKGVKINEVLESQTENPPPAEQFLRVGENSEMEIENKMNLKELRAFSMWVKFDIFSNNARIFDFGNGSGHDNVFLGIEGKGNDTAPLGAKKGDLPANVVCQRKAPREIAPAEYMKMTESNVELWDCPGPQPVEHDTEEAEPEKKTTSVKRANLIFEIWDKEQRKMRMKILDCVQEAKWHHIAFTTKDMSFLPTWEVYIDGLRVFSKEDGCLPQTNYTIMNYIGRSNWETAPGQGEYKDERFRGSLFDFRMYRIPMSETKILKTLAWGKKQIT